MSTTQKRKTTERRESIGFWLTVISISLSFLYLFYYIGRWTAEREHKEDIILLNQKHNQDLTDLKIDFNNQLLELKSINRELKEKLNNLSMKGGNHGS